VPNLAVIEEFIKNSRKNHILYVGERKGVEKEAVEKFATDNDLKHFAYKSIVAGKLRRYFSLQNFVDIFKVPIGVLQSYYAVRKFRPDFVFSKGGFVSVPVVFGAVLYNFGKGSRKIPIVIHESDLVPGLANRIAAKAASHIFVSFEESRKHFKVRKGQVLKVTGNPIRGNVLKGDAARGQKLCGFHRFKPVILTMGGSLGARQINKLVWGKLDDLLKKYQVVHITGKGNLKFGLQKEGYKQFELLFDELPDVYALCELVVSRGGANSLAEIAALGKKAVIIPLGTNASRGDQIVNAKHEAAKYGWQVLNGDVDGAKFLRAIDMANSTAFSGIEALHKGACKAIFEHLFDLTIQAYRATI